MFLLTLAITSSFLGRSSKPIDLGLRTTEGNRTDRELREAVSNMLSELLIDSARVLAVLTSDRIDEIDELD